MRLSSTLAPHSDLRVDDPTSSSFAFWQSLRLAAPYALAGLAAVGLITFVSLRLHLNLTTVAFFHLITVVFLARLSGFWTASVVSVSAVLCQLYFLVPPVLTWRVSDWQNVVALATFEYCALVVTRLSNKALRQAEVADRRQHELEALYTASRLVLLIEKERDSASQLVKLIRDVFGCAVVSIYDPAAPPKRNDAVPDAWAARTTEAYVRGEDSHDHQNRIWFRVLRMGTRPVGALAVSSATVSETVANALASLVAIALERSRAFENESRAEIARQSEQLRTAVLDALAHDVKTPLTSIRTASSGLLEAGALDAAQSELVRLIDSECAYIAALTERLLRMARLDTRDVHLKRERVDLRFLTEEVVGSALSRAPDRSITIETRVDHPLLSADRALLVMAITQLLDNALKYSTPGSPISVAIDPAENEFIVSVHNFGPAIAPTELNPIFERFYRAGSVARVAGTGLGLSITRKIAEAHSGRVWVSSDPDRGTRFFLALPAGSPEP